MIKIKRFRQSLKHALRGVKVVFRSEQSFRVQVIAAVIVLLFSWILNISSFQYIVILFLIGAVLTLELINSIIERIVDTFKPRIHPAVRDIKDIMAATVLIVSVVSTLVAFKIFWPYLIALV